MTKRQLLEARVRELNELTNSPAEPYARVDKPSPSSLDPYVAQLGNWHVDSANGGYMLVRMSTDGGGTTNHSERVSVGALAEFVYALNKGIRIGIQLAVERRALAMIGE